MTKWRTDYCNKNDLILHTVRTFFHPKRNESGLFKSAVISWFQKYIICHTCDKFGQKNYEKSVKCTPGATKISYRASLPSHLECCAKGSDPALKSVGNAIAGLRLDSNKISHNASQKRLPSSAYPVRWKQNLLGL